VGQQTRHKLKVETKKGVYLEIRFLLYLPEAYDKSDKLFPLLLFLHGSEERGEMLEFVKKHGPPKLIESGKSFPFIIASPQCPEGERWSVEKLDILLDELVSNYNIDRNCIMVTGLSMGGQGTWNLAYAYPKRFAAIVPICGRTDPSKARKIKDLPIWVFHGDEDDVVPVSESENMVKALKAVGSNVKYTVYAGVGHESWEKAYSDPKLWEWMESQCQKVVRK
jgi:predicted peptidase